MNEPISRGLVVLAASLLLGFIALGWLVGHAAVKIKKLDRTVVVKGLSEREVLADIAIWPLTYQEASNDLNALFGSLQRKNAQITEFLAGHGTSHAMQFRSRRRPSTTSMRSPMATRATSCTATRRARRSPSIRTTSRRYARR